MVTSYYRLSQLMTSELYSIPYSCYNDFHRYGGVVVHSMASINVLYDKLKEACLDTRLSAASNV